MTTNLHNLLSVDLIAHIEEAFGKPNTLPQIRRMLAIKGYEVLARRLSSATEGLAGAKAVAAITFELRQYVHDAPGLAVATWQTPDRDDEAYWTAALGVGRLMLKAFGECGLSDVQALTAMRMMRALVRGYVLHELGNAYNLPLDRDESFARIVNAFVTGLPGLAHSPS